MVGELRFLKEYRVMPAEALLFTDKEAYIISRGYYDIKDDDFVLPVKKIAGIPTFYIMHDLFGSNLIPLNEHVYQARSSLTPGHMDDILRIKGENISRTPLESLIKSSHLVPKDYYGYITEIFHDSKILYLETLDLSTEYMVAIYNDRIINFAEMHASDLIDYDWVESLNGKEFYFMGEDENVWNRYHNGKFLGKISIDSNMYDKSPFLENSFEEGDEGCGDETMPDFALNGNFILDKFTDDTGIYCLLEEGSILYSNGHNATEEISKLFLEKGDSPNFCSGGYAAIHLRDKVYFFRSGEMIAVHGIDIKSMDSDNISIHEKRLYVVSDENILEYEIR